MPMMKNDLLVIRFHPGGASASIPWAAIRGVVEGVEEYLEWTAAALQGSPSGPARPRIIEMRLAVDPQLGSIELRFELRAKATINSMTFSTAARSLGIVAAVAFLADASTVADFVGRVAFGEHGIFAHTSGARSERKPEEKEDVAASSVTTLIAFSAEAPTKRLAEIARTSGCSSIEVIAPGSAPVDLLVSRRRRSGLIGGRAELGKLASGTVTLSGYGRAIQDQLRVSVAGKSYTAFIASHNNMPPQEGQPPSLVFIWASKRAIPEANPRSSRGFMHGNLNVRGTFVDPAEIDPEEDVPLMWENLPVFLVEAVEDWS